MFLKQPLQYHESIEEYLRKPLHCRYYISFTVDSAGTNDIMLSFHTSLKEFVKN